MHTDVQMKYVSKLTDARRASRGRNLPYSIVSDGHTLLIGNKIYKEVM